MKYNDWLNFWLEHLVKQQTKLRTYKLYRGIVQGRLRDCLGRKELDEITPLLLQNYISELADKGNKRSGNGLSANTINCIITIIQCSLKTAFSFGLLSAYTADRIKRPKAQEPFAKCFTLAEQKKLENAVLSAKNRSLFGVFICLYTGLRIGELLALTWEDLDLKRGILIVDKTCYYTSDIDGHYRRITDMPKTPSSRRLIPLSDSLISILRERKKAALGPYVISSPSGSPIAIRSYQNSFSLLLLRLNIPHRSFHTLRHTFATRALESGMDVKTLSELLGHKSATVTLSRYAHVFSEHKRAMMNKLWKNLRS